MKIPLLPALIASAALGLLAGCANNAAQVVAATPGCLDDVAVNRLVADYNARRPAADLPATLTMADAACTRSRLQQRLAGQAGRLVGYKAGLTNPAVQSASTPTSRCGARSTPTCCWATAPLSMPPLAPARCTRPTCWCA